MTNPSAVLSILVSANISEALAQLTQYQRKLTELEAQASRGLGGVGD